MQITKLGRIKDKTAECHNCGASLKYTPADLKVKSFCGKEQIYISCPVCKATIGAEKWEG